MNDFLQDYQDHLCDHDKSEHTIRAYMADLRLFSIWLQRTTGELATPDNITPMDVIDYRNSMLREHKRPATINRTLISISGFCQWAQHCNLIPNNPVEGVRNVVEEPLGPRALDRKEQLALLRAVRRTGKIRDLAIITVLLHTGIRVSELCNLRVSDISISDNSNMLTVREGKGTKRRNIPLNPTVSRVLKDYIKTIGSQNGIVADMAGSKNAEFLFYGQKRMPLTDRGVRYLIKKYSYLSKIPNVSPHILRHTCAKNLIDAGNPIDRVAKILGHSSINTTSIYTMPTERDLHMTMDSISWE